MRPSNAADYAESYRKKTPCKRLLAVLGFRDFVIGAGEHIADDLAVIRLVFDHQNALAHTASTCRSTTTGSVNENVEP
jgi:hypothetical protein